MKDVFEELEAEGAQYAVDRKRDAIELKNLLIANDNLIAECLSQEVFYVATNSELNVARFTEMYVANTTAEARCLALDAELATLRKRQRYPPIEKETPDSQITKVTDPVTNLQAQNDLFRAKNDKVKQQYKELYDSIKITCAKHIEQVTKLTAENVTLNTSVRVNSYPNASGSQPEIHVKANRISPAKDKMADVSAPSGQTPAMAPPLRADDQILPHIRCQLDEQWFVLTKETLRDALQITPVNNNQAFVAPLSIDGSIDFVNQLGYPKLVRNLSNVVTNDLFQPWRALLTIINLCLTGKTSGFERTRAPVLQILWGRKYRFHPRSDSPLYLSNEEPVLGYLKFSAKGTKSEVFGMPIPDSLITAEIRQASYYREYQEKVAQHRRETGGVQDPPAPKPTQPTRKPKAPSRPSVSIPVRSAQHAPTSAPAKQQEKKSKQATETSDKPVKAKRIKRSVSRKTRQPRSSPKSVGASEAEEVPAEEPQVADEDVDYQKAVEESMKDAYALPKGPLPPVVIREPESRKYQPLPEVPGKGKAKVTEEQVAHDLLSLQKHNKTSPTDQYIFQSEEKSEKVVLGAEEGGQDKGQAGLDPDAQVEDQTGSDAGAQAEGQVGSNPNETAEGQAGSNPDETSEGQAGPDPGDAEVKVQSIPNEGFTATVYPNVQENLKLAVEEPVLLEEPASSSGTLSSLQHLSKDFSFGDQFFSDKPSKAKNDKTTTEFEIESMVSVSIQQDISLIPPMTSPIIDLSSRPKSPKRIGELEHIMANLIHENKDIEKRLDKHGARLYTLEQLDIPQQELAQDLAEARKKKKKKKSRESPKTPPGSPSHQPPPPPPPAGPSGPSGSSQEPPPPPPPLPSSTSQESPPSISLTPADLEMDEDMAPDEQAQSLNDEDIGSAHIPTVNLRQGWWKPFEEERPTTPEPDWSIRSSDVPVLTNNWASALASNYSPPPEDLLLVQTGNIATFMDWFCKRRGITELKPQDLEGPAYEIVKRGRPHTTAQRQQTTTTGGLPSQVIIQSDFFFNKDLEYLRYGSKGRRPALSISKMKAAYYPDARLEQMVTYQFWIEEECKYDIAAMAVRTHMQILSVVQIEVFSMYGYDYMKKIVLRRADLHEHVIAERDFKYLYLSDFEDLYLLNLQGHLNHLPPNDKKILTTAVNLTKPQWTATSFEYKHDYTIIESPRAVIFRDKYGVQMMMRFNEIHKFSDGTLLQIDEALDYRVKEFRINKLNPGLNTRFWTTKGVDRCNAFMFAIHRRLKTRRIFRNLESFVGGREKSENKGRVPTEMELELELTQQGSSYEVSKHLLLSDIEDNVMDPVTYKFNPLATQVDIEKVAVCSSLRSLKSKRTIESRAKRLSKIISLGHYYNMLASSHTVKMGLNSLVHSSRALSALRRSGLRTASTAAKPCQGDSSEFYLITGNIHTDQRGTVVLATVFNESEQRHSRLFITNINLQESQRLQLLAKKDGVRVKDLGCDCCLFGYKGRDRDGGTVLIGFGGLCG
nr:integrase, catalytic region, zinc finger, CCHC-type, peptidase aspartic, catalytic [Tanacetum cinerariifolium]